MDSNAESDTLPVFAEEARIDKRAVSTGRVRIQTVTDLESEVASAELEEERVEITRVPVNTAVDKRPAVRTENDTVIIPVMEEVLVVHKQLILKEELHVRRRLVEEQVQVPVTLRKQRAVVERLEPEPDAKEHKQESD